MKSTIISCYSMIRRIRLSHGIRAFGVALILLFSATAANASHYRYGSISYKFVPLPPGAAGACAIEVTVSQAWRMSFFFAGTPAIGDLSGGTTILHLAPFGGGPDISTTVVDISVSTVNAADDWFYGVFKHTFVLPLPASEYLLYWDDCCRIGALVNDGSGSFRSECRVSSCISGNKAPVTTMPPIVTAVKGAAFVSFPIPAADPDGDPITYRLALPAEFIGGNPPGFAVTPGGTASIPTLAYSTGDLLHAVVAIEDPDSAKTMVDFIIEIVDSGAAKTPPAFDFSVTPSPVPCLSAEVGKALCFWVKAFDVDSGDVVDITAVGVPIGAITAPSNPSPGGNPDSMMVCWTPGPGDVGGHVITFTAEDMDHLSAITSVCIDVKADTACVPAVLSFCSDSTWWMSTTTTMSNNSGTWSGVAGVLPAAGTFTIPATVGNPYPWPNVEEVPGAKVIKTTNNITYFRKEFTLASASDVAKLRINVDDMTEIYLNGVLVAGEYNMPNDGWKNDPHSVDYDGLSVDEPYLAPDVFDYLIAPPLSMLVAGTNEVIVVVRNLRKGGDKGGFSACFEFESGCAPAATDSICVSDTSWRKSTVYTASTQSGYWSGVPSIPADPTFTEPVVIDQPYPFYTVDSVPGAYVIDADTNGITYYKKTFELSDATDLDADFLMTFDDAVEVYLNGVLLFRENKTSPSNWMLPAHSQTFTGGMANPGDYDYITGADLDTVAKVGTNCIVVVLRNFKKAGDRGAFSFRMKLTKAGAPVIKKDGAAEFEAIVEANDITIYPNPSKSIVNVVIPNSQKVSRDVEISLFGLNGELLAVETVKTGAGEYTLPLDLTGYANGMYYISVKADGAFYSQKVLKQ